MQTITFCPAAGTFAPVDIAAKHFAAEALAVLSFVEDCTSDKNSSLPVELLTDAAAVVLQRPDVLTAALTMYLHSH